MKQKEVVQLSIAGIIFVVAGILIFSQLGPKDKSAKSKYTYEDVQPVKANFDSPSLEVITDSANVKDFYLPPDLNSGIGNQTPFKTVE